MPRYLQGDIFQAAVRDRHCLTIVFGHTGFNQIGGSWREFRDFVPHLSTIDDPFTNIPRQPCRLASDQWFWFVPAEPCRGMTRADVEAEIRGAIDEVAAQAGDRLKSIITNGVAGTGESHDERAAWFSDLAIQIERQGFDVTLISLNDVFVRNRQVWDGRELPNEENMTNFRAWMAKLCEPAGDRPEWPLLLMWMLHEELQRSRLVDCEYAGETILIPRLERRAEAAKKAEDRAVYGLYERSLEERDGLLTIGDQCFWLLSYQVPNQHHQRRSCADLLALTMQGGLRVFECKSASSRTAPVAAMLEGLDYLACLLSPRNFARVQQEFVDLRATLPAIPEGFVEIAPTASASHGVIVLAPQAYFDMYDRSRRGSGWFEIASVSRTAVSGLEVGCAIAEIDGQGFYARNVTWAIDD